MTYAIDGHMHRFLGMTRLYKSNSRHVTCLCKQLFVTAKIRCGYHTRLDTTLWSGLGPEIRGLMLAYYMYAYIYNMCQFHFYKNNTK